MTTSAELAREMETVRRALAEGTAFVVGLDNADRARTLGTDVRYSPLRTLLEHALQAADRVAEALGNLDSAPGPPWRDGGGT